ncbi:hypothetical protein [Mycobacterium asiaticum]|uniref:hypothetical protein n=1 Tax=Mycobacterium asiaticum TaxID=1790 RepID=UPI0007EEF961|nr:hypothetical protein [Mycobacterium asiaticum]OBI98989.1 hypothetical protein A5661_13550 [Mycobacterium asiaticum]
MYIGGQLFLARRRQCRVERRHIDPEPGFAGVPPADQLRLRVGRVQIDHGVVPQERGVRRAFGAQQRRDQFVSQRP